MAPGGRHRRTCDAARTDGRIGKSVRIPVSRTGVDIGHSASAAYDADACGVRGIVRDRARVRTLPAAMVERRSVGAAADLHARRLALDPPCDRLHLDLRVADYRGSAPASGCTGRNRTG